MSKDHNRKAGLLGTSFGAANGRLRKALLFKLAGQLGLTNCYRCGIEIDSIDDFSVEHMEDWMGSADPVKTFFDLDNIAFSHRRCNSAAANGGKTHCPQGHEYTDENTAREKHGHRSCQACAGQKKKGIP